MPESEEPESPTTGEDTRIRDHLARDRTLLANERTLLAYIRTALALLLSGASAFHFLEGRLAAWSGGFLMLTGAVCFSIGVVRCLGTYRRLGSRNPRSQGR